MRAIVLAAGTLSFVCLPLAASAQNSTPPPRVRVSINAGIETINETTSQSFSVQKNLETEPISSTVAFKTATLFDGGVSVRVTGGFGVGIAVSTLSSRRTADVTASVPHPFFFNQPRLVTGTTAITRRETAAHIDAIYVVAAGRAVDIAVSGGPTVFNLSQPLVTDVSDTEAYPFDTAAFASAATTRLAKTAVGYNVGADVTWKLSRRVGVGALVRFARAQITLTAAPGNSATIDAGGLQAGGGLRLVF